MLRNTICNVLLVLTGITFFILIGLGMLPTSGTRALSVLTASCLCVIGLIRLIRDTIHYYYYYCTREYDHDEKAFEYVENILRTHMMAINEEDELVPDARQQELLAIMQEVFPDIHVSIVPADRSKGTDYHG